MSMYLEFKPHSWYRGFAIKHNKNNVYMGGGNWYDAAGKKWYAVTANGMSGYLVEIESETLKDLKQQIKQYRVNERKRKERLYKELEQ